MKDRQFSSTISAQALRRRFLEFFESKGHKILPSASLIPRNDPTLLLTGAGMVPFKPYFLGTEKPEHTRVTTCQRCLRTADIDNVGKTARHCTFFEMLGNFSFGDYFKREAIAWAWEFVTKELGLPRDMLWITIYLDDDEAFEIWNKEIGVPEERILRLGKKDNFWEIGVGPCGPCSEIHVDRGPDYGCGKPDCGVECDCDRFMEIWNLVFIQFHRDEEGNYIPLAKKSIDTGMGLERICSVMQGVPTVYETDEVRGILDAVASIAGVKYGDSPEKDAWLRIITDHMRGVTFLVSDGVLPSNEGRGYVLRRLLRRAARNGRLLGIDRPFLGEVTLAVIGAMTGAYPELAERRDHIVKVITGEEERFLATLDQGMEILREVMARLGASGEKVIPGEDAFRLYDTYGFPLELIREIGGERGFEVDEEGFALEMERQRERARAARKETGYLGDLTASLRATELAELDTDFIGYSLYSGSGRVLRIFCGAEGVDRAEAGTRAEVILDRSPFYAEGGGQVGDTGRITWPGGEARVLDTRKVSQRAIASEVEILSGSLAVGDRVRCQVDVERRLDIARNHTATHLLHKALRTVLGEHVRQAGSLVAPERLRFDFTHMGQLSPEELSKVEEIVNEKILENLPVDAFETSMEKALSMGAIALFGEKYGNVVRVVRIGDFSMELCGGTHAGATGQIGLFKILQETGVAAGTRRIEAVTGRGAYQRVTDDERVLDELSDLLKVQKEGLPGRLRALLEELREARRMAEELRSQGTKADALRLIDSAVQIGDTHLLVARLPGYDAENLRNLADILRDKLGSGVILLGSETDGKAIFVATVTPDLVKRGFHAGKIADSCAQFTGGRGGGRPEMAQAGGRDITKLDGALEAARDRLAETLMRGKE